MPKKTVRVVLVRLCECEGNVLELLCRHGRLTELGKRQALAARTRIGRLGVSAWFSPDNTACRETCEILSGGAPVQIASEFREPPYPQWAGKTLKQIRETWPNEWLHYWNPRPGDAERVVVPGGEPLRATLERLLTGLDRLYAENTNAGAIVGVTHGEIVRLLTVGLLGAPLEHLFRLHGRNGAVTILDFDGKAATFECINDSAHLVGLNPKDLADYVPKPA